jgi:hypothetical protein
MNKLVFSEKGKWELCKFHAIFSTIFLYLPHELLAAMCRYQVDHRGIPIWESQKPRPLDDGL